MSKTRIPRDMHVGLEKRIEEKATAGARSINELHKLDHSTNYDPDFIFFNELRRRASMRRLAEYQVEQEKHSNHIVDLIREEAKGTSAVDSVVTGGVLEILTSENPTTDRILFETPEERYARMASVVFGRPPTGSDMILHESLALPNIDWPEGVDFDE